MTTLQATDVLAKLQEGYDRIKPELPRTLAVGDELIDDLELDSLDFIDLVSMVEDEFPPEVVDAVIDRGPELRTVGDVVECLISVP